MTFPEFCQQTVKNAPSYKTEAACKAAITKIQNRFRSAGSYGCQMGDKREAIAAVQDRCLELIAIRNGWV